jgi:hypothetical protein
MDVNKLLENMAKVEAVLPLLMGLDHAAQNAPKALTEAFQGQPDVLVGVARAAADLSSKISRARALVRAAQGK